MGKVLLLIMLILSGCNTQYDGVEEVKVEFREIGESMRVNYKIMVAPDGKNSYAVSGSNLKIGEHVTSASLVTEGGSNSIIINLNSTGSDLLESATEKLKGKRLAVLFNDELVNAALVAEKISGGSIKISLGGSKEDAQNYVLGIRKNIILRAKN